ncbi:MAG: aminomethyl-transferring glycine dehydrogenase, partial [SAR324 cluster bacterium]|nr:aminomethyl-transferring glycine dehydrogenase [SAR324 cluster bacterium]
REVLKRLREIASKNEVFQSYIGMGYFETFTPPVIQRNILENPGWYTQYTPYQPEISQGRLEALLNFQTMVSDLTGLPIANASLLDEASAAAEAMLMSYNLSQKSNNKKTFLVSDDCYPQTIGLVETRAKPFGIKVLVGGHEELSKFEDEIFGALFQYPTFSGQVIDYTNCIEGLHRKGIIATIAADILALCVLKSPGEMGADIAVGSTQRFGIPLGYGGPHAAYFATKDEFKRSMPGRLVGVSRDAGGKSGLRLALQTREQHIRREKATSNICTAQVLLAIMASMYAVYHGPKGLRRIATRVNNLARTFAEGLKAEGFSVLHDNFFDTVRVHLEKNSRNAVLKRAAERKINLCVVNDEHIGISWDECKTEEDVIRLLEVFRGRNIKESVSDLFAGVGESIPTQCVRNSDYLTHNVFNSYHSETEMLRYIKRLESRDLSLCTSMIPLGSCTMKLNAAAEMLPISWPEFNSLHPFAPLEQAKGYQELFNDIETALCEITGFEAVSLQPNSGAQGEYAGLMSIRNYHESRGQTGRNVCLIPKSAHGTNPASSAMAGFRVVVVECDKAGNIDLVDLKAKAKEHRDCLAAVMITYPSTHGVFESHVKEIAEIVHRSGGQVYLDGANMNALVGMVCPAELGADVCHINLHKTFAIPHGGGGPGMGPIAAKAHLADFLPGHSVVKLAGRKREGAVSSAPWGSASILPISWAYIALMGAEGLKKATQVAILNANYVAKRLEGAYSVLYKGESGFVAHECIIDLHALKENSGIDVDDVAKRLIDYSIHAPTVSWPVAGTIMFEPTESESKYELDRFCEAMLSIKAEAKKVEDGVYDKLDNPLKNAPHTLESLVNSNWNKSYSREEAAFPVEGLRKSKFWSPVGRIDASYGDKNLVCKCISME